MKESAKVLFLRPILFQETITAFVVVPMLLFFFMNVSTGVKDHFLTAVMGGAAAANLGLVLGFLVKYTLVKPAIAIMEKGSADPSETSRAVRMISILPMVESVTVFFRFALFGNLMAVMPMFLNGYVNTYEFLSGISILIITGAMCMPFFYLASENSLVPFFQKCSLQGVMNGNNRFFAMSLNAKLLATILVLALSPMAFLFSLIFMSITNGLDLSSMKMGFLLLILQTVIMTFVNGFLIMRSLKLSVGRMSLMFEDMAVGQGDLTKRLHVSGLHEVGKLAFWFNQFMDNVEQVVGHVMETSMQLHQSIEDVNEGSQDLSQATQEQAASIEEVSSSIEEMSNVIRHNAGIVSEGRETSNAVTRLIGDSKALFSELNRAIEDVTKDSRRIGDIVLTVNEVAFHTNLLALNASVEAARAGEHGKGFAVVAGEVRSLAQRSAEAASQIKNLIEGTVGRIKNGDEVMKKTSSSLEELMSRMDYFFTMMETISTSSVQQAANITELNKAVSQIDSSTQHNASTVEELASTLDNLRVMAGVLAQDVKKFKTNVQESFA